MLLWPAGASRRFVGILAGGGRDVEEGHVRHLAARHLGVGGVEVVVAEPPAVDVAVGQLVGRDVEPEEDDEERQRHLEALDPLDPGRREVLGAHQLEDGPLQVGVADHHRRLDPGRAEVLVLEGDAGDAPVGDVDPADPRAQPDVAAGGLDRLGQAVGDHLRAACRIPAPAHEVVVLQPGVQHRRHPRGRDRVGAVLRRDSAAQRILCWGHLKQPDRQEESSRSCRCPRCRQHRYCGSYRTCSCPSLPERDRRRRRRTRR